MNDYTKLTLFGFSSEICSDSKICIFGSPFDGTVCGRPGTRYGPNAIRNVCDNLETYSPYLNKDILDISCVDMGDLTFPFGNKSKVLKEINQSSEFILSKNNIPLMIGGEHLCSLSAIESVLSVYSDLIVLQFDAHTDLRKTYLGESLSHATVMWHVLKLLKKKERLVSYGLRSGLKSEFELAKHCLSCGSPLSSRIQRMLHLSDYVSEIGEKPVYITFDLDIFDPSIFPGTGTPEPGGIFFDEFIDIIQVIKKLNIVGLDIMELNPLLDSSGISSILAAKVLRELLLCAYYSYSS